jgi:methylenetetrahydrofolate dehydrogenase (NADP+) / methenyltetrahydrofolate cyclohydrolase
MPQATLIDGKAFAEKLRTRIAAETARLKTAHELAPSLAVVLVGQNPASQVYVRNKSKQATEAGIRALDRVLPQSATEPELLDLIAELNSDTSVHGILVQLPLPRHINAETVLRHIDPDKDVDGFHPINVGLVASGQAHAGFVPCTPLGCLLLLQDRLGALTGKNAVVVGRSNIVGKPMAHLLLQADCTVTIAHSRTRDLPAVCRGADILVAAVGKPQFVPGDWIKPGGVVIDVGINRIVEGHSKPRIVGDVAFDEAREVASAITPVPGGVGPMTIACLLANTIKAACRMNGLPSPEWMTRF